MVDKDAVNKSIDKTRRAFGDISKMSEKVLGNISVGKKSGGSSNRFDGLSDMISGGKTKIATPKEVESMFGSRKGKEPFEREDIPESHVTDILDRLDKIEDEVSEIKKTLKKI
jgi:hypothetical protein